jgi:hypothetical protein
VGAGDDGRRARPVGGGEPGHDGVVRAPRALHRQPRHGAREDAHGHGARRPRRPAARDRADARDPEPRRRLRPRGPRPLPRRAHPGRAAPRARQRRPLAGPGARPAGGDRGVHHRLASRPARGRPRPDDRPVRRRRGLDRAGERARRPALAGAARPVRRHRRAAAAGTPRRARRPLWRRDPRHLRRPGARDPLCVGNPRRAAARGTPGALGTAHRRGHAAERRRRRDRGAHRRPGFRARGDRARSW